MSEKGSDDEREKSRKRRCAYGECGKTEKAFGEFTTCILCLHQGFPHPNHYCDRTCEVKEFRNRHRHDHEHDAKLAPADSDLRHDYLERLSWAFDDAKEKIGKFKVGNIQPARDKKKNHTY